MVGILAGIRYPVVGFLAGIQLSAMVMTHGDTFRQDPTYLERLVVEGDLVHDHAGAAFLRRRVAELP